MAAPSEIAIVRGPGKIVLNPTSGTFGSASAPYGGVYMGAVRGIEIDYLDEPIPVPLEEFSGPGDMLEGQGLGFIILSTLFRSFDSTAIAAIFPNTSTGSSSGTKGVNGTVQGSVRAGHLRSSRVAKILFVPDTIANQAVIIYKALPVIVGTSRTAFSILRESALEVAWYSIPDTASSGRTYQVKPLADMTIA